jgi:ribosome-associated toxin RatA of RatAB toxin-antitoxin module
MSQTETERGGLGYRSCRSLLRLGCLIWSALAVLSLLVRRYADHITAEQRVDASPEDAFALVADHAREPSWLACVSEVGEPTGQPDQARHSVRLQIRAATLGGMAEVIDFEPGRRLTERLDLPLGAVTLAWWFASADGGCRVRLTVEYSLPGGILAALVNEAFVRREVHALAQHSVLALKAVVESQAG